MKRVMPVVEEGVETISANLVSESDYICYTISDSMFGVFVLFMHKIHLMRLYTAHDGDTWCINNNQVFDTVADAVDFLEQNYKGVRIYSFDDQDMFNRYVIKQLKEYEEGETKEND